MSHQGPRITALIVCILSVCGSGRLVSQTIAEMPSAHGDRVQSDAKSAVEAPTTPAAQGLLDRKYLFGDWDGERTKLEQKGLKLDLYYTDDALANPTGGPKTPRCGDAFAGRLMWTSASSPHGKD